MVQVLQRAIREELGEAARPSRTPPIPQPELDARLDVEAMRNRFQEQRAELYRQGYDIGIQLAQESGYARMAAYASIAWDQVKICAELLEGDDVVDRDPEPAYGHFRHVPPPTTARERLIDLLYAVPGPKGPTRDPARVGAANVIGDGLADALKRAWELVTGEQLSDGTDAAQVPLVEPQSESGADVFAEEE